jgi:RNA polymerase sigma-70 factor (ECF subfamily)
MTVAPELKDHLEAFGQHRQALFALAYRMLGSAMDADDILQEAYLRWRQAAQGQIAAPRAYLITIVTRLCIDELRSARARREAYVGPWLPEPLVHGSAEDPAEDVERAETLSFAFLLLLERLTPLERAVLLLHDVFEYTYSEIAPMVGASAAHCRQLGHRARERTMAEQGRFVVTREQVDRAARRFVRAYSEGDLQGLLELFATDIALWSDGGGKVVAARKRILGADRVARFLAGIRRKASHCLTFQPALINGQPGLLGYLDGQLKRTYSFAVGLDGRIHAIYCVQNPDKLCLAQNHTAF